MTQVDMLFLTPESTPIANSTVEIQLLESTIVEGSEGVLVPRPLYLSTDGDGRASVLLAPVEKPYRVTCQDALTGLTVEHTFYVPDSPTPVELQALLLVPPPSMVPYDEAAIAAITANKVAAQAAQAAAEAAAAQAEESLSLAVSIGNIFPDTATGLAATTDGTSFNVLSAEAEDYLILYLNDNGVAVEQKRLPSSGRIAMLEIQVAEALYEGPAIDTLTVDGLAGKTVEVGVSLSSVTLAWTLSGAVPDSQTIDNGVGVVPVGTVSKVVAGPFTTSKSWQLTVLDLSPAELFATDEKTVTLNFRQKHYWGVSASAALNSAAIIALSSEFATARGKSVSYDATGGRYLYYAYPESWGALTDVRVGGLPFSDYSETIQSFTNASGHTENYRVIRFNGLQSGTNIQVVWA